MLNELFSIRKPSRNRGFSLIELLVVISIIGMLSSVAFGSFRSAQTKATNAKNIDVIGMYIFALESYRNDVGHYPVGPNVSYHECFSDRASNTCGVNGGTIENSAIYTALSPYIHPTTALERISSGSFGGPWYFDGPVFECAVPIIDGGARVGCTEVRINWYLRYVADTVKCGHNASWTSIGDITVCSVSLK